MYKILFVYDKEVNLNIIAVLTETPKRYLERGFKVDYLFKEPLDKNTKNKLKGINIKTFSNFEKKTNFKYINFFLRKINYFTTKKKLSVLINKLNEKNSYDIIYLMGIVSINSLKKKNNQTIIHRFFGTWDLYKSIKNKNIIKIVKSYISTIKAIKKKCDLAILTDDGTNSDKVYKKFSTNKYIFLRNGFKKLPTIKEDILIKKLEHKYKISLKNKKIFISINRLVKIKRIDRIIKIISKYKKINPNFYLILLGGGPEEKKLKRITNKLNLTNNILFEGQVPQKEVYKYLKISDIFISASDGSNITNSLIEAIQLKKIIFTLDSGNTSEIIKHKKNRVYIFYIYKLYKNCK